jgi:thiol-disulfide isomerase/thioredoxin
MKTWLFFLVIFSFSNFEIKAQKNNLSDFLPKDTLEIIGKDYKYFYVDVWASYCAPCLANFKFLNRISTNSKFSNMKIITLNLDFDSEIWQKTLKKINLNSKIHNARLDKEEKKLFVKSFNCNEIPRYLIFDNKGNLINKKAPGPSNPELAEFFEKLNNN